MDISGAAFFEPLLVRLRSQSDELRELGRP
jgi:hypothetical protein